MVHIILDGSSDYIADVYSICSIDNRVKFEIFLPTCGTCSKLPSNLLMNIWKIKGQSNLGKPFQKSIFYLWLGPYLPPPPLSGHATTTELFLQLTLLRMEFSVFLLALLNSLYMPLAASTLFVVVVHV